MELIEKYRGIAPGVFLNRQLKKKDIKQNAFAKTVDIPAQTLNAIIKGTRKMTTETALKIDRGLGIEESTMAMLQAFYETKLVRQKYKSTDHPDFKIIRKILFWDTDFDKIDWQQQKKAVICRVWERGNEEEKQEMQRYYGNEAIDVVLNAIKEVDRNPSFLRQKDS